MLSGPVLHFGPILEEHAKIYICSSETSFGLQ